MNYIIIYDANANANVSMQEVRIQILAAVYTVFIA